MRVGLLLLIVVLLQVCLAADYYKVLGLNRDATQKQIKTAFRKLSLKYHPDKNKDDPESEKKFVEVSQAYQVLSDPEQKEKYDQFGEDAFKSGGHHGGGGGGGFQGFSGGFPGGGGGGGGFGFQDPFSFFNNMFGSKGGGGGGGIKFNFGQGGGQQQQQGGGFGGQQGGQRRGGGGGRQQQHQQQQQGGGGRGNTQVYEYSADIQFLNTKKFEEKVKRGDGMWLIQFFSSSDPESQKFVEAYEKVAQNLKHYVNVAAVNFDNEKSLVQEYQITSTPHLMLIPHGGYPKRPVHYSDGLDAASVTQFAFSHIVDYTHVISGIEDGFFQDQALPQVLLFSAKDVATPLYKSLARDLKSKFKFGLVPQKASQVLTSYQIKTVPTLLVIERDGSNHPYKGEMKYPALLQFLQGFKSSAPPVTPHKVVNQHRQTDGEVHQLTKDNIDTLCGDETCVVLFSDNKEDLAVAKTFAAKYRKDGLAFAWLRNDASLRTQLLDASPRKPECVSRKSGNGQPASEACVLVALKATNSNKSRFTWLSAGSPLDAGEVGLVLDRVVGGDMQWTRESIHKDEL